MRILIVGGTRFVGRHITEAALAAGHEVSLLHRGKSGADLFPEATHLLADRNSDPALQGVLAGREFDLTIDVSAYFPRQVDSVAEALAGHHGRYVFVSSVSVYAAPAAAGYDESSPVRTLPPGPVPETITEENYGALKALCEKESFDHFGPSTLVLRPTYVVGPWDHSGRFPYWVHRIAKGGVVLAPGYPDRAIQVIDARDFAAFALLANSGTFHIASPHMPFGELLEQIAAQVAPAGTRLEWVDPEFLLDAGENGATLPLWYAGDDEDAMINTADPGAALKAGLTLRPLAHTVRDVCDVIDDMANPPGSGFLTAERESELLAAWSRA